MTEKLKEGYLNLNIATNVVFFCEVIFVPAEWNKCITLNFSITCMVQYELSTFISHCAIGNIHVEAAVEIEKLLTLLSRFTQILAKF